MCGKLSQAKIDFDEPFFAGRDQLKELHELKEIKGVKNMVYFCGYNSICDMQSFVERSTDVIDDILIQGPGFNTGGADAKTLEEYQQYYGFADGKVFCHQEADAPSAHSAWWNEIVAKGYPTELQQNRLFSISGWFSGSRNKVFLKPSAASEAARTVPVADPFYRNQKLQPIIQSQNVQKFEGAVIGQVVLNKVFGQANL